MEHLGAYDKFQGDRLGRFLGKMADTQEGDGTMLDNTIVYYGTSNSKTHVNRNYPLLVAGGKKSRHKTLRLSQLPDHRQTTPLQPLHDLSSIARSAR